MEGVGRDRREGQGGAGGGEKRRRREREREGMHRGGWGAKEGLGKRLRIRKGGKMS